LDIGYFADANSEHFNGKISYVKIYNSVLNNDQIKLIITSDVIFGSNQPNAIKVYTIDRRLCDSFC